MLCRRAGRRAPTLGGTRAGRIPPRDPAGLVVLRSAVPDVAVIVGG